MTKLEIVSVKTIYLLKYFSEDREMIWNITETIEDAYDLAVNFLIDTFDISKEDVILTLNTTQKDYVDLLPKGKVDYFRDIHDVKKLATSIYYFRIVRTSVDKIVK